MLFRGPYNESQTICTMAQGVLESFGNHGINNVDCNLSDRHESVKWEPPLMDLMKLNVDAAVNAKKGVMGYGAIV